MLYVEIISMKCMQQRNSSCNSSSWCICYSTWYIAVQLEIRSHFFFFRFDIILNEWKIYGIQRLISLKQTHHFFYQNGCCCFWLIDDFCLLLSETREWTNQRKEASSYVKLLKIVKAFSLSPSFLHLRQSNPLSLWI